MEVSEITILCAFDYAVGRKTYVVNQVADDILYNVDLLSDKGKAHIHDEISRLWAVDCLGHDVDKKKWLEVLEAVR